MMKDFKKMYRDKQAENKKLMAAKVAEFADKEEMLNKQTAEIARLLELNSEWE